MELLTPNLGLIFWTGLSFMIVLFLLSKFAWKPITSALEEREQFIEDALQAAEKAKQQMAKMESENERLLNEAKEAGNKIMKEAKEAKDKMIEDAKNKAKTEAANILENVKKEINDQKMAAMVEVKNEVGTIAIDISRKILSRELKDPKDQEAFVTGLIKKVKLN